MIFDPLDFKRIAAQIAFNLCRVLGAHHAAVATLPIETGDLIFTTASGAAPVGLENLLSGASRLAVREGRPDATPDVLADPRFEWTEAMRSQLERVPYRALLHVPVTLGGTMIGLLLVGDRVGRVFDEDAIELACMFADQTAIALESARLGREARRRQRETDLLAALATEMDGSLDLGTLLQRIVDGVIDLISCDQAAIRLREPDGGMALHARAHRAGITPMPAVHRIESGKGAGGFVLLTGQPLRTGDYAADPRITRDYVETVRASGTAALMVMPIRLGGSIEGLLYAMNRSARPFTEGDEAALLRLAGHAAVALRQATLLTAEQHARQEVEMLSRKFVEVQDAERSHLAGELHDQVGQLLTVLQLTLSPGTPCPDGVITDRLAKANDIVVDLIRRIRKLSVDLRPFLLDDFGLIPALIFHCDRFSEQTGIVVTLEHDGLGDERFTQAIETAVYRVAQEALTNVARHAGTSAARVRLSRDAEFVTIQVADEGRGFEPGEAQRGGSGLAGMRSRMRALAGQLTIDTGIGAGVRITARIPVPADGHERSGESSP